MYLLHILLIILLFGAMVESINITSILRKYVLLCGNQLCNNIGGDIPDTSRYTPMCPTCSCDISCYFHGNCCPDIFFSLNMECVNATILSNFEMNPNTNDKIFSLMKTSCEEDADNDLKQKCEGNKTFEENLKYLPVTSEISNYTYINIYCAECHNDTTSLIPWTLDIECLKFIDFNFISSFDEIFTTAIEKGCTFSSFLNNSHVKGCRNDSESGLIKSCNVTGTWTSYDQDIEYACANYDNNYRVFNNVFCYMCNPPVVSYEVVFHCNVSERWDDYDSSLEAACENLESTPTTFPFKNIFCYLCNIESNERNTTYYLDSISNVQEEVFRKRYFKHTFDIEQMFDNYDFQIFSINSTRETDTTLSKRPYSAMENIYEQYYAMTGNGHFCENISDLVIADDICNCDDACLFNRTQPCCIDKAFKYSTTCLEYDSERYLVYDGCENIKDGFETLSYKCNSNDTFISSLPVYDKHTSTSYKNIYCGLCRYHDKNSNTSGLQNSTFSYQRFKPWTFQLTCEAYTPMQYIMQLSSLFDRLNVSGCNISFVPDICHKRCSTYSSTVDINLVERNPNLVWACQNFNAPPSDITFYYKILNYTVLDYENIFCSMARFDVENSTELLFKECNMTGKWNKYDKMIETKCLRLPAISFHLPYKNIFCKMCNNEYISYTYNYTGIEYCEGATEIINHDGLYLRFRNMFALSSNSDEQYNSGSGNCKHDQIYDSIKEKCINIVCYPGRALVSETCRPILTYTSNLGYVISFGADIQHNMTIKYPESFLEYLRYEILLYIERVVGIEYRFLELAILKANKTCNSDDVWSDSTVHVTMFFKIFISNMVERNLIERKLIDLLSSKLTFTYSVPFQNTTNYISFNCFVRCKFGYDEDAVNLPTWIHLRGFDDTCFTVIRGYLDNVNNMYVFSRVSRLLECPQIELDTTDFTVSFKGTKLMFSKFTDVLNSSDFYLTKDNTARICVDTFEVLHNNTDGKSVLEIVLMICTILSLIALGFTCLTYCLFPVLRTLPGKNNINLIISMFFALAFLEFGVDKTSNKTTCTVLGAFIHYFWLCTFCCLNVCSFHMYHTFNNKMIYMHDSRRERRQYLFYVLYSYGSPALIVFLNIISTAILTDNKSYGYGNNICFITNRIALILAFITPVSIICLQNLFFFVSSAYHIASNPKVEDDNILKHNKIHFSVYLKLFIITGCSWILQILDSFLPVSAFSVIVSFLNSFQGVYIFLSYICNKRVFILYKNGVRRKTMGIMQQESHDTGDTHTTTLFLSSIRKRFSKWKKPGLGRMCIDNERIDLTNSKGNQIIEPVQKINNEHSVEQKVGKTYCANIEVDDGAVRKHSKTEEIVLQEDIEVEENTPQEHIETDESIHL